MAATGSSASRLVVLVAWAALMVVVPAEGARLRRDSVIAFPGFDAFGVISGLRPNASLGATTRPSAQNSVNRAPPAPAPPTTADAAGSNGATSGGAKECSPSTGGGPGEAVEAMFHLGMRLEHLLRDPSVTNLLHSPAGLVAALGQLALAAKGQTLSQLEKLLGCGNTFHDSMRTALAQLNSPRQPNTHEMSVRNGLFHQPPPAGRTLKADFASRLANYYNTEVVPADFRTSPIFAQQQVNQWALKASHGKIEQLVPYIPPRSTTAILSSVAYFKAKWANQFSKQYTYKGNFYIDGDRRGRTKMVDFMTGEFEVPYSESPELGVKIVGLPYVGYETAMFLVMPLGSSHWKRRRPQPTTLARANNETINSNNQSSDAAEERRKQRRERWRLRQQQRGNSVHRPNGDQPEDLPEGQSPFTGAKMHALAGRLDARTFETLVAAAASNPTTKVSLFLPRLSLKSNVRLREALAALGADAIFGDAADFSGAVDEEGGGGNGRWAVDEVWQQSRLEVTEEGTEAASGTAALIVDYTLDGAIFKANSPFTAIIRHMPTGVPVFWATIADPS